MDYFPASIIYPNGNTVSLEPKTWLLSLKTPLTAQELLDKLNGTQISLKQSSSKNPINNTNTRFWITRELDWTVADLIGALKIYLGPAYDWVGPAYTNPKIPGEKGIICPLPNVLVVKFKPDISPDYEKLKTNYSMKVVDENSKYYDEYTKYFILDKLDTYTSYKVKSILESQPDKYSLISFENMPMLLPITYVPDDADYNKQWNMQRISAGGVGSTTWDLTTGSKRIVICVIDSGCDLTHPDLKPNLAGSGKNLNTMLDDGSPVEPPGVTEIGHGTAVAGIISARINNSIGVAGVAGRCKILPFAFVNWTEEELIRGINAAGGLSARVVNMSFALSLPDTTRVDEAISQASSSILFCASSGNDDKEGISYPANHPLVMACGATNQADRRKIANPPLDSWGSNFGEELSVMAPGVPIPTTDIVGSKGYNKTGDYIDGFFGTSAAVPHLSGLAGLIFSVCPGIDPVRVRDIIENTTDKVGDVDYSIDVDHPRPNGTWNNEMGYGRINTLRAVIAASTFNPDIHWFRTVEILSGTMTLNDHEKFGNNETDTFSYIDGKRETIFQLGPFDTHDRSSSWQETVGGEIRATVDLFFDWKTDSSVDVVYAIALYEGTTGFTNDFAGSGSGTISIPEDQVKVIDVKVTNTSEGDPEDFVHANFTLINNRRSF
ncbi:S8 family serine peptidase [Candidatus Nitrosocosmicus arcticus]|uniref:Putative Subtilisin n=1 Tax=Candidatus Nitrosocosmicus arcticus TaxID=2035267 RepID=A0A557SXN6_9ARCH|nr:S8 family serine peptidase [Candidatus Nitrosocosmicus arcticus]TVP41370.1 putative Subtilisin [Candidatus Nitrosocosmicus arcticus]